MAKTKNKKTDDAVEILHRRLISGNPDRIIELEKIRADDAVARKIYDLRKKAGLSQREFAKLVGTTASVICRLEDADYEGHSLAMLNRIAKASINVLKYDLCLLEEGHIQNMLFHKINNS